MSGNLFQIFPRERNYVVKKGYKTGTDALLHVGQAPIDYRRIRDRFLGIDPSYFLEENIFGREFLEETKKLEVSNLLERKRFDFIRRGDKPIEARCILDIYSNTKQDSIPYGATLYLKAASGQEEELDDVLFPLLKRLHYVDALFLPDGRVREGGYQIPSTLHEMHAQF